MYVCLYLIIRNFSVLVSDVPFIVSGKRVGILDPHTVFISNKEEGQTGMNIRLSEFSKFADQVAPFVNLFGFDQSTKDYDGTLFRFPFRRNDHSFHSKISDKCYTSEEVIHELYSSLKDEASHILLFLKYIESIELYTWDHTVNAQKLYLQIELEPDCLPQVRELRRMCMEHCKDKVSFTNMGAFNVQVMATDFSDPKKSSWLVCNTVGSSDSHVLSLASKLKVLPWCGIAAPLPHGVECQNCSFSGLVQPEVRAEDIAQGLLKQQNCFTPVVGNWKITKQDEGYAFCFLPLKDPTGLPVCIHGYFRVASNRRSIEWPNANNTGESALWNKHLMEALVVPSYAILLASKCYLLSYIGTSALAPADGVPDPYSWLPLPQEVKHSEIWRHLLGAKPSVQSLLTASPVWRTAADGGKWVKPDGAYVVSDAVPARVTKLLITLNCPVVSLPHSVEECFCFGVTDSPFRYVDQRYVRYQLQQNAEAAALHLKDTVLCLEVLDYITSDLSPRQYSHLEGLPVIPLAQPGSAPRCLLRKQPIATEELVYIVTDDLTRSILPGLDNRLLSSTLPPRINEVFLRIADSNQFCLTKVTPHIVCPGLIEKSMKTWNAQPGHSVLWIPRHEKKGETDPTAYAPSVSIMPEHTWLTNLWEWLRSQKEVSLATIKHLPIVPMVAVSSSVLEQVQLCPLKALGTSLRQPTIAVSQQIADVMEELSCTLVPHAHIFIGHEDTLNLYLPTVSPLSLLRVLKNMPNACKLVMNISTGKKDILRGYLLENIAAMDSTDLEFLRSLVVFKTLASEYVNLQNLHSIIFPPTSLNLTEDVPFPTNILCISAQDYDEYRRLLGREPETVDTFIISYVGPFALCKCSDTDRNKLFLWILQQLRVSQGKVLCNYLTKTAFLPSNSGDSLYCPQALYDPEDEFLKVMFAESESAFPLSTFHSYLVELKDLGLKTRRELQRSSKAFQAFILDRAQAVIQFDPAKASQCSKHILKALCDDADRRSKSTRLSNEVKNIPFLFCQSSPPESYPAGLAWAGSAVEVPVAPSSLCASKDQQHLSHLVGSVSPVLSHQYRSAYNEQVFKCLFKEVSVDMVCQHFRNVVALDSRTLSDNAESVTKVMESVYLFLQQTKGDVSLAPRYIWHESCKVFLPLEKVAWAGIHGSPLVPYRYTLQDIPGANRYHQLWKVLGVQKEFEPQDVLQVLSELQGHLQASNGTLTDDEVSMVIQILKFLQIKGNTDQVLMPTVKCTLLPAMACTYDDRELTSNKQKLLDSKGIVFTHNDVSKDLAQHFKVPPVTSKIARPKGLKIKCEKAGQSIELTRRIGNIIKDYEDSIDVFKELIQNADDAGATEVKFLIDWRQHGVDQLFNNEMRHWQGPALYAYNNGVFSPEDFENIRQVEAGTKLTDPTKIGRFGLGFCSVYQLTDVPSFLSANKLVVFDPHMHFLGASLASGSPGISIDFVEEQDDIEAFYQDQVAPYHNVFGCNVLSKPVEGGFQGTLFRFPFRGMRTPRSDICSKTFYRDEIKLWKSEFKESAQNLLIFLRHVKLVGLYELESDGNPSKDMKEACVISCEHETHMFVPRDLVEEYHRDPDGVRGSISLASKKVLVDEPSVTKKGKPKAKRHEQNWLVSSAVGSEESFRFARSSYGIACGLVPLAEVAVKTDGDKSALFPQTCDEGQVFCFLPLPIACDLKFQVNGFFDVSSNRRSLKDLQDRSKQNVWNRHLITDCLSRAVLGVFRGLQQCHPVDSVSSAFLESYYKLFPSHDATDAVSKELKPALLKQLQKDPIPLFHVTVQGVRCWKNHCEAHVLQRDFHSERFSVAFPDMMHVLTEVMGLNIAADVPEVVQDVLKDLLQIVTLRQYYTKYFIPNLPVVESCCQLRQIIFLLKNMTHLDGKDKWLEVLLKESQCIPTAPNGILVKPTQLIDPCGPLQELFDECEEHFPATPLRTDKVRSALRTLGMCHDILDGADVVERAQSIVNLSALDMEKSCERSRKLLMYISKHSYIPSYSYSYIPSLDTVPFIPVMKRPDEVSVPWKASDAGLQLCSASEMFKDGSNLVFSNSLILDPSLLHLQIPSSVLEFKAEPTLEQVALHLKNLTKWASDSELSKPDITFLTDTTGEVYTYLEIQLRNRVDKELVGRKLVQFLEADKYAVVWDENTGVFLKTGMLALQPLENVSLAPYRLSASEVPALKRARKLWKVLGIRDMFSPADCINVLHEMPTALTKKDVSITVTILHFLFELEDTKLREHMLVPTTKQTLLPPSKCYYNDFPWKQQAQGRHLLEKYDFVDTGRVPPKMAQKFGVQAISAIIGNPTRLKIKHEQKGQQIPVTRRINRLLEEYSEIDDVFKELIQNADDAEAGVIKFLIDWRQHKTERLLKPEMASWQGPALYVYNDKTFSDQDFDNICELEGATKKRNPAKIGRFGVGFCSVYHLTDVPSFVSRSRLQLLDPLTRFLTDATSTSFPGILFDFVEEQEALTAFYADQMAPYDGIFGCKVLGAMEGYDGTLFRFPFRSEPSAISKRVFKKEQISQLKDVLMTQGEKLVLFLQHLRRIELYEVCEGQDHTNPSLLVSLERDSPRSVNLLDQFKNAVEHGSRMTHYTTTQQFTLTRSEVVLEKSPKSKKKKKKKGRSAVSAQSSTTWLVASAVGDNGSNSWKWACSAEGRERGDVPVAEVAVPIVDEGGVLLPKQLPTGQVFCFLPLPITISDQKCLINGYFEISKNRRDLAELQNEEKKDAWNRLLIRDVLVKAYIAVLKHLTEMLPCDENQRTHFLECYYKLWPVATAGHPLSKELQVAFKNALCHSDVPLLWSLADGGKWLPFCMVKSLDSSFHMTLFDTVRKDILDILVQQGHSMVELPHTIRTSLCSGPDSGLAIMSFRFYCEEVLLKSLPCLPHDVRDSQLLFLLKHLGALNDAEGEDWLVELLKATACVPCEPSGTLSCPENLVFPEGLLFELYDVDEERFPSKAFSEMKQSLMKLGMNVHELREEDVLERAETMHTLPAEKARQRCESFLQYLTTVHFVHKVKNDPWNWHEHIKNTLIENLSDIAFLPVQQRPNGSTVPWFGDTVPFASPREVYSESESDLLFTCKLLADLPPGHDVGKLFLLKARTHDDVLHHISLIVKWAEAEETRMTIQDHTILDRCMPAVYERLSNSLGCTKQADLPSAQSIPQGVSAYRTGSAYVAASVHTTTAGSSSKEVDLQWKERVVNELKNRPFIWQESNNVKRFHIPAQTVSDRRLKHTFFPYLVKLSPGNVEYQQFFKALGVESTVTTQKIAGVLESIAQDWSEAEIGNAELMGFIVHVAERHFHYQCDNKLIFYLPDRKGVMRPAKEMAYPEEITESDFFPEELSHGLTHFVNDRIPKADAKRLGVQDILANIMRQFEDNEYYKEEDFGQKEEICTRLNNILKQYPADVSIFKEFIQNAEDAMATEIAFVIDHRHSFGEKSLFAHQNNWKSLQKMPALLVFNNRKFQEKDIQSIKKLGTGGKAGATDKIGRFGVGFNVAYHVTDCPTLVSFGEGGLAENFCAFDPQFKYVPSRLGRQLPGARYRMKNMDGKNSSEHFPDQFAPFLMDMIPVMAKSSPGSFADLEAKWPQGYSVFRLPLTRIDRHRITEISSKTDSKSQELLGHHMIASGLSRLARDLTEQAPGMLLFLNHLKRISVFEVSDEGTILSQWTVEARHSSESQEQCSQFATKVRRVCTTLTGDGGNTEFLPSFGTMYSIQLKTTERTAAKPVTSSIDKKPANQSQTPRTLSSSMHTASPMPVSSTAIPTTSRRASKSALKQLDIREPKSLTDDKPTEELVLQQTESNWVISKRFGLSDIHEELLYNGCEELLFPLAGVAILLPATGTHNEPTFTGSLYSHLPLPVSTDIPAHINAHFWVDPSRKHLEGSSSTGKRDNLLGQWNATMIQEVASRAYVDAVVHCKEFVKNSVVSRDWFNSLLLAHPTPSSVLDTFQFSKCVYQLMIERECEVLIADAPATDAMSEVEWLALTVSADNPRKGWFFVGDPEVRGVLLSIGVRLVSTPLSVNTQVSLLLSANSTEQKYCGEATVDLARTYLKKIAYCYDDFKDVIVSALVPLFTFVLQGIESPEQCIVLDGLPLMLTKDDQLRLIDTDTPLFTSEFIDLLPGYCMQRFVSHQLKELRDKLFKLKLVTPVSPEYLAENIDLPKKPLANFKECSKELLQGLWHYIAVSVSSTPNVLDCFHEVSIIPTSQSTLVSVDNCKTVLREYGSVTFLQKLRLPVLDFSLLCDRPTNVTAIVKERLAVESRAHEVLHVIENHLIQEPTLATVADVMQTEVDEFVGFLLKQKRLHDYVRTLKKLNIYNMINDEWTSLEGQRVVYALPQDSTPEGLIHISNHTHIRIIEINHTYHEFYKTVGVQVLDRLDFYTNVIIRHFQFLPVEAQIAHLQHMLQCTDLKAEMESQLCDVRFIHDNRRAGCLHLASEYYDPDEELLKEFLQPDQFPPDIWCENENLQLLRQMGLRSTVSDDMWRQFARSVKNSGDKAEHRAEMLLSSLRNCIQSAYPAISPRQLHHAQQQLQHDQQQPQHAQQQLQQFLHSIASIEFVPYRFPSGVELLFRQLRIDVPVPIKTKQFICFQDAVFCEAGETKLVCLSKCPHVDQGILLGGYLFSGQLAIVKQLVTALGLQRPSVALVCQNLKQLVVCSKQCTVSSDWKSQVAVQGLQKHFTCHYDYLAKYHDEQSLREIARHLKGEDCLFLPSDLSFSIERGANLVKAKSHHTTAYAMYLHCIPEYLASSQYSDFLRAVGVLETLSALHYIHTLEKLATQAGRDPNIMRAIHALYFDLIALLEGEEGKDAAHNACICILGYERPILLPSCTGELLPADQLVLNDAEWLKERLEQSSGYNLIMPPPPKRTGQVSLPPCLGVQPLSKLIFEELDKAAVLDRDNRCEAELTAEAALEGDIVVGCPYSGEFVRLIQSDEFGHGLRRMMSHNLGGDPLSREHEQAIEAVQNLDVKCVYAIRTHLRHCDTGCVPGSDNDDVPCFLDDCKCLYVRFHPRNKHDSNVRLLNMVVKCINIILGGRVDSMHLRDVLESCNPVTVEQILDQNRVRTYKMQEEDDGQMTPYKEGQGTAVEDELELVLTCNFREGDLVKYCSEDSRMVIASVCKVTEDKSRNQGFPFPPTLYLKISSSSDEELEHKAMSSLLVCKFLTPAQIAHLKSLSGALGSLEQQQQSRSGFSQVKDVLLELPCHSREDLQRYFTGVSDAMEHFESPQRLFAIERLLFQLHFHCVHRNNQPGTFSDLVELLIAVFAVHCTEAFIRSLKSKVGSLLHPPTHPPMHPHPILRPDAIDYQQQDSYRELSSWSIPTVDATSTGTDCAASTYLGRHISPPHSSPYRSSRQTRVRQSTAHYPIYPTPGRLTTGGSYIWGGGMGGRAQQSIWPEVVEEEIPVPGPTVSLEDAFTWLKDACRTVQLVKELETVQEDVDVLSLEGAVQASVYKYPETLCFYAHEIVLKCLKAVFFAYCGLPDQLVECSNLVQLHQTLMDNLTGNCEAENILCGTLRSYVHLVSGHGDCCRFPSYDPPALPCDTHSPAVATEVLRSAMCFVEEIQELAKINEFFPEGLESFTVVRPDSRTAQEGG